MHKQPNNQTAAVLRLTRSSPHPALNSSLYRSTLLAIRVFSTAVTNYSFYVILIRRLYPNPSLFCLTVSLSSDFLKRSHVLQLPLPPSVTLSFSLADKHTHTPSLGNDGLRVIVCLCVERPHHPVECHPLVLMVVRECCNCDTMVITLEEC